jgi:hypothetical protein
MAADETFMLIASNETETVEKKKNRFEISAEKVWSH